MQETNALSTMTKLIDAKAKQFIALSGKKITVKQVKKDYLDIIKAQIEIDQLLNIMVPDITLDLCNISSTEKWTILFERERKNIKEQIYLTNDYRLINATEDYIQETYDSISTLSWLKNIQANVNVFPANIESGYYPDLIKVWSTIKPI